MLINLKNIRINEILKLVNVALGYNGAPSYINTTVDGSTDRDER